MAWNQESRHARGYGYQWTKLRDAAMRRDKWLCQPCKGNGRTAVAKECDHIIPKAKGGTDALTNLQAICQECHTAKTAKDEGRRVRITFGTDGWPDATPKRWGYSIPDGVKPSGIPVVLVCGPPASGKSTFINQAATPADTVIDFDALLKGAGGKKWDTDARVKRLAFRRRDEIIHSLHSKANGICYLIVTAPSQDERNAWCEALGNVTVRVLTTPAAECIARIQADLDRQEAADRQVQAVLDWWAVN